MNPCIYNEIYEDIWELQFMLIRILHNTMNL